MPSSIDAHLERSERSPLLILCLKLIFLSLHKNNFLKYAKKYLKNSFKVIKYKKEGGTNENSKGFTYHL